MPREDQELIFDLQVAYGKVEAVLRRLHEKGASTSAAEHALDVSFMWAMRDFAGSSAEQPPELVPIDDRLQKGH